MTTPDATAPAPAEPAIDPKLYLRTLLIAVAVGIPVAAAASAFSSVYHAVDVGLWQDLPKSAGWTEPPWWYVIALPTLAGGIVALALQLPGKGGHSPAEGLSFEPPEPKALGSILIAALASLGLGIVVGPEAPLLAIGMGLGLIAGRLGGLGQTLGAVAALAGGFAALSTVFGGPLPSSLLIIEALAASGRFKSEMIGRILVPGLVAAGVGDLIFTGVAGWEGVHEAELSVPGLEGYGSVRLVDVGWGLVVAAVTAPLIVAVRAGSLRVYKSIGNRAYVLLAGGAVIGLMAVIFRAITDKPIDLVLFSGEEAIPSALTETSAGVLVAVVIAKTLAYGLSLGAGFRGGPIFPSVFIGVAMGVLGAVVLPGADQTPLVVAGIAAAAAAGLRLPFTGALLAALLAGSAGTTAIPIAILAAVVGWLIATVFDQVQERRAQAEQGRGAAADPASRAG